MSTDLTVASPYAGAAPVLVEMTYEEAAGITGMPVFKPMFDTPNLSPNSDYEDEAGNRLTPGTFKLEKEGTTLYSKPGAEIKFRVIFQAFRFIRYDNDAVRPDGGKGMVTNESTLEQNLMANFPDVKGTLKCGKVKWKKGDPELVGEQAVINKQTSVYRFVFGYVSGDFLTPDGKTTVHLDNQECYLKRRGADFLTFEDEVVKPAAKIKRMLHNIECTLRTDKHVNGKVTYYTVHYDWNKQNIVPMTLEAQQYFERVWGEMGKENVKVLTKHKDAVNNREEDASYREAVDTLEGEYTAYDEEFVE